MSRLKGILETKPRLLRTLVTLGATLGVVLLAVAPAGASSLTTVLYSYYTGSIDGSSPGPYTISNQAVSSPYASHALTLDSQTNGAEDTCPITGGGGTCNWVLEQSEPNPPLTGVQFSGGTNGSITKDSVAYFDPTPKVSNINIGATQAAATESKILYYNSANTGCTSSTDNTPNISEIGHGASTSTGQIKLQLSDCIPGNPAYAGCRISGDNNRAYTMSPFYANGSSSYALENGDMYDIRCAEVPVMTGGAATGTTLTLSVVNVSDSSQVIPNKTETVSYNGGTEGIGSISTNYPISVGNKWDYSTPPNTNQFNGIVSQNVYCEGDTAGTATLTNMWSCLTTGLGM